MPHPRSALPEAPLSGAPAPGGDAPADAARALLDGLPVALLHAAASGAAVWANAAARAWHGAADVDWAGWLAAAPGLIARPGTACDLPAPPGLHDAAPRWLRATAQPGPIGGWTVALQPLDELRATREAMSQLEELLDLARDFGRLGLWERNVHTLEGHWDRQVFRFRGMEPTAETPSFEQALQMVAETDREPLRRHFMDSLRQPGRYSHRYSMRSPDGTLRRVHSQWIVKPGPDGLPERAVGLVVDDTETLLLALNAGEMESQLALAVDLGRIAVWRHDIASERVFFNRQGWAMLGLAPSPEGMALHDVRALIHPDDLPRVLASANAALGSDLPTDIEARYRHADGGWRELLTRRVVQSGEQGRAVAFLGVGMDMTDRLAQSRHAQELARRFELVTRTAGIGHWSQQPGAAAAEWSPQLRALFGMTADAPLPGAASWLVHCVHADDRARVHRAARDWLRSGGETLDLDFRIVRPGGSVRQLMTHSRRESQGATAVLFGVVVDVTERRVAEQELERAVERAALATRAVGMGTWESDLLGHSARWDDQMWLLRGRQPEARELSSEERMAFVHPDDVQRARQRFEAAAHDLRPGELEFRVVWPDGQVRWLASRSLTLRDAMGRPTGRIGVNWDTTDARNAAAMRQESEVARAESLAKSRFLARMSHELRTPLNAVLGFAQLLLAEAAGDDPATAQRRRRLEHVRSAGQHLLALINDVLDLASLDSGEQRIDIAPVDLQPLVEGTLPMIDPLLQAHGVTLVLGPCAGSVLADATRLRQVLLNLLSNAVKYNRRGGQVRLEARLDQGPEGARWLIDVTDTGRGMSEEQLRHLFEPFNRLGAEHAAIEGSGIGLTIARALAQRMGGTLQARSQPGVGSVFTLTLAAHEPATGADGDAEPMPLVPPAADPTALPAAGPVTVAAAPRRILYVEDNPINAMIIRELLALRPEMQLEIAPDGLSGVARATEWQPDLVLLDMQLPDIDGLEVMRRLHADPRTAQMRCIALSANAMPADIDRALRGGATDYWTKPLDFKAFLAALDALFKSGS